jgi:hypothetical protein
MFSEADAALQGKDIRGIQEIIVAIDQDARGFGWKDLRQFLRGDFGEAQMLRPLNMQPGVFVITARVKNDRPRLGGHCDELLFGHPRFVAQPADIGGMGQKTVVIDEAVRNVVRLAIRRDGTKGDDECDGRSAKLFALRLHVHHCALTRDSDCQRDVKRVQKSYSHFILPGTRRKSQRTAARECA